jgi:hypothetical protein
MLSRWLAADARAERAGARPGRPSWQDGADVWILTPTLVRFLGRVETEGEKIFLVTRRDRDGTDPKGNSGAQRSASTFRTWNRHKMDISLEWILMYFLRPACSQLRVSPLFHEDAQIF